MEASTAASAWEATASGGEGSPSGCSCRWREQPTVDGAAAESSSGRQQLKESAWGENMEPLKALLARAATAEETRRLELSGLPAVSTESLLLLPLLCRALLGSCSALTELDLSGLEPMAGELQIRACFGDFSLSSPCAR